MRKKPNPTEDSYPRDIWVQEKAEGYLVAERERNYPSDIKYTKSSVVAKIRRQNRKLTQELQALTADIRWEL